MGHFTAQTTRAVLVKIAGALVPEGVFCGSESLGSEGSDQMQFFADLKSLGDVLSQHFAYVWLREVRETVRGRFRQEALRRGAPARIVVAEHRARRQLSAA